jgi:hypothetical protein
MDKIGTPSQLLKGQNAIRTDVEQPWEQDNQAWWDWYVSLADNDDPAGELTAADPLPDVALPDDATLCRELADPYPLTPEHVATFRNNGFIKLPQVLSAGAVLRLRAEMKQLLETAFDVSLDGGAEGRFFSLDMVWLNNPLIRAYVLSSRIAKICVDLLGVPAVRLYHDNLLSKEPRCGRTPWHYDDHHFPLATNDVVTAWIPAQPIPRAMGPLAFAMPIDAYKLVESLEFSKFDTSYDREVARVFQANGLRVEDGPFAMGEVSFHHNLSFHTAAGNRTTASRMVLANTYYADGARVLEQPTMVSGDWNQFIPGAGPGEIAASPNNPVCWPVDS